MSNRNGSIINWFKSIPQYILTLIALMLGIGSGGLFPEELEPIGQFTAKLLEGFISIVPFLIFFALGPAITSLVKNGQGGRLAGYVIVWYILTSTIAGLLGVLISSFLFDMNGFGEVGSSEQLWSMFRILDAEAGVSVPLLSILAAVLTGLIAVKIGPLNRLMATIQNGINRSSKYVGYIMIPLIFLLGITLGLKSGAKESVEHYVLMTVYTLILCFIWWALYLLIVVKGFAKQSLRDVLTHYYFPTAIFAAGTCSSLATLPINLDNCKKIGVRKEIADFVLPVGAIVNLDTSALAYVAYAPFILTVVFDIPIGWDVLLMAWPAIVLFTVAAPGLPAGMGTALWSSTLFASLLGLEGELKTEFIATWIALSGGIPDMLRTATNCTSDGFTAIFFNKKVKLKTINNE